MSSPRDEHGAWVRDTEQRFRALAVGDITVEQFLHLERVSVHHNEGRCYAEPGAYGIVVNMLPDPDSWTIDADDRLCLNEVPLYKPTEKEWKRIAAQALGAAVEVTEALESLRPEDKLAIRANLREALDRECGVPEETTRTAKDVKRNEMEQS